VEPTNPWIEVEKKRQERYERAAAENSPGFREFVERTAARIARGRTAKRK
jgi:hypothetical protein